MDGKARRSARAMIVGDDGVEKPARFKKNLVEALKKTPDRVVFVTTWSVADSGGERITVAEFPPGLSLSVVGPDPDTRRDWFATVEHDAKGVVAVTV